MLLDTLLATFRQTSGKRPASVPKKSPPSKGNDALVGALLNAREALSITELAAAMGCSIGESSKRVKAAGRLVNVTRDGRRKMVKLRQLTWSEWQKRR